MSIQKYEYEISVWKESLAQEGQRKIEKKMAIIGAHDMSYQGKATKPKFITKINGTHELSFEMPDKYFDSKIGDYIHNEFVDALFNECKIKFYYKEQWYEFYIKKVSDVKNFKSYMRTYTCSDAFIDELSRNGYGITFDEELYNNVEEVGVFSEEILEDSTWEYDAHLNWGDFTEYTEEKLLRVPLSLFGGAITAHKVNYNLSGGTIQNIVTGETREVEMGDDLARELGQFWDQYGGSNPLLTEQITIDDTDNEYIYIPYSQLDFCYVSSDENADNGLEEAFAATEYPANYGDKGYAIAPNSVDPNHLIQFLYIPEKAKINVDEAGLILNKDFTYVITVKEWNDQIQNSEYFYKFEDYREKIDNIWQKKKVLVDTYVDTDYIYGNRAGYYDGYLDVLTSNNIISGKKIAISDRTEINISKEIDQYVKVYNNTADEYADLYTNENWIFNSIADKDYRVCSKIETRQIVPQLARNLVQNGKAISSNIGWEIMQSQVASSSYHNANLVFGYDTDPQIISVDGTEYEIDVKKIKDTYLTFNPAYQNNGDSIVIDSDLNEQNAIVNFGIIGQEKKVEKGKIYALSIIIEQIVNELGDEPGNFNSLFIRIGNGELVSDGDYQFKENGENKQYIDVPITLFNPNNNSAKGYILIRTDNTYDNPYIAIYSNVSYKLSELTFFEAYTRGIDQFDDAYFRYSGRDLFSSYTPNNSINYSYSNLYNEESLRNLIIFEDTVMPGDIYEQYHYFIQKLETKDGKSFDTFMAKSYTSPLGSDSSLPLNAGQYTDDDYTIYTNYIDLNNCSNYNKAATKNQYDCSYGGENHICLYQKYGYCPYRFQTEKHCRKIRTLKGEKSNRFNLTQELGKNFKIYPVYYISHNMNNGKILTQEEAYNKGLRQEYDPARTEWPDKRIYYITEKGKENKLGFRYEKNLSNISRNIASDQIVTKLYVLDTDSDISKTGLCSIKTAEDNPSKDSFIIDFSYYVAKNLLNKEQIDADLYGINTDDMGYLKTLGYLNTQYDNIANQMINISAQSFTELQANLNVNLTGIETAQKELRNLEKKLSKYTIKAENDSYLENKTYLSYHYQYMEQYSIYVQLIEDTFYTNGQCIYGDKEDCPPADFLSRDIKSVDEIKKVWVDTHDYDFGILGQFNKEYNQLSELQKESQKYQKRIKELSNEFYKKYEPFLKEGTWSDTNFVSDNAYYFKALDVAKQGAIPKVQYNITTVDIEPLYQEGDYIFDVADTTYVEDIGMFGINIKTGLPNRLKTIVSSITENPDSPADNSIVVADFTTQFDDLFQQVTASVQTLTFNENIYNRSSNFTSLQTVKTESLQGTLDNNNLELVHTNENNIKMDWEGQSGSDLNNHNNKYKLNGQGLFFSNNGGESWNTAITPNGINADYIKTGTLDVSKIRLVDGNYIYFGWDTSGIFAYRDPATISSNNYQAFNDYACFNKYGLSLIEKGKIKLRAGYSFISNNGTGDIDSECNISDNNKIGFYLYNSAGKPIFSTETSSGNDIEAQKQTARIKLIGEMLATNAAVIKEFQNYLYGGDSYIKDPFNYYDIPSNDNIIHSASCSIDGTVATYTRQATSKATVDECAAFIAYDHQNDNLTQIIINDRETEQSYEFNSPSITTGVTDVIGAFNNSKFFYFSGYTAGFSSSTFNGITSKEFIIIAGTSINFKGISSLGSTKTGYIAVKHTDLQATSPVVIAKSNIVVTNLTDRYTENGYYYYQNNTISNLYKIGINYYTQFLGEQTTESNGQVALYLNNRTDLTSDDAPSNSRLFSCCKSDGINVSNIFTILKDGSLHMGGTIINEQNATEIKDQVDIINDFLIIQDNIFKMSFDNIRDINSGDSIVTYISNQLTSVSGDIMDEVNNEINSLSTRQHYHYIPQRSISWNKPDTIKLHDLNVYDLSLVMITVTVPSSGYSDTISLKDFLDSIRYYDIPTYGGIYTEPSTIG